jgi:hypothetical protein
MPSSAALPENKSFPPAAACRAGDSPFDMAETTQFTLLPAPWAEEVSPRLRTRLQACAKALTPERFSVLIDAVIANVLDAGLRKAAADEGTLWLACGDALVPVWNNGPDAGRIVLRHRQPLQRGLVSMVYHSQQPCCENQVYQNALQDSTLDVRLSRLTCSQLVAPLAYAGEVRGVISAVRLKNIRDAEDPPGFDQWNLRDFAATVDAAGRLIDWRLVSIALDWSVL